MTSVSPCNAWIHLQWERERKKKQADAELSIFFCFGLQHILHTINYVTVATWRINSDVAFHESDHTKLSYGKPVLAKGS